MNNLSTGFLLKPRDRKALWLQTQLRTTFEGNNEMYILYVRMGNELD